MNSRKITFLSLLISATIVGRIFFQSIPNVQPVTMAIIFVTIYFGAMEGILLNIIIITISNLYLGFGLWTIYQIISYSIIILIVLLFKKFKAFNESIIVQSIFSFFAGFIYGFVISVLYSVFFSKINNFWTYYLYGIAFDFLHAIGNFLIYIVIVPILLKAKNVYFSNNTFL